MRKGLTTDPSNVSVHGDLSLSLEGDASVDGLTGVLNRVAFQYAVGEHLGTGAAPPAMLVVDLDDFRYVNDSLGHERGDELLMWAAATLARALDPGDFVGRVSGDEFAVCLPGRTQAQARRVAADLLAALRRRVRPCISASAGVAVLERAQSAGELLVAANIALARAKRSGHGGLAVHIGERGDALVWAEQIRTAIDEGRFALHAQPIVDATTGERVREELLVRLVNEQGAILPPALFLPVAEAFGLIEEIDLWVVDQALELAGGGRPVSVNLSARSVGDPEITRRVWGAVAAGVDPDDILFEITETTLAGNMDDARGFAERLGRIGAPLALDDFGTGFGSFLYLKSLPVSWLKIDMEFVRDLAESRAAREVVRAVVGIAKGLGQRTIAEGVEDDLTLRLLRDLGVDQAQGYALGRPEPV